MKNKDLWPQKGLDRTLPGEQIEIVGLRRASPVLLEQIKGAKLTVPAGSAAAQLREGLRGSVIEDDLQSLCAREDGVDLLTGCATADDASATLQRAGLSADDLTQIGLWDADEIAVQFIDGQRYPYHRIVWAATRDGMSGKAS